MAKLQICIVDIGANKFKAMTLVIPNSKQNLTRTTIGKGWFECPLSYDLERSSIHNTQIPPFPVTFIRIPPTRNARIVDFILNDLGRIILLTNPFNANLKIARLQFASLTLELPDSEQNLARNIVGKRDGLSAHYPTVLEGA